jgi:hypothetical protein
MHVLGPSEASLSDDLIMSDQTITTKGGDNL